MSASLLLYVISLEMLYVSLTPIIRYQSRDVICQPPSYYTLSVWRCYMSASLLLYIISLEMLYVSLTPIIRYKSGDVIRQPHSYYTLFRLEMLYVSLTL
jgi:hypothetical protein